MSRRLKDPRYLRAAYPLNGHAQDVSRYGNHGTWVGTEAYAAFLKNSRQAGSFDGGPFIDCGPGLGNALGTRTTISLSCWFKTDVTNSNDGLFSISPLGGAPGELDILLFGNSLHFRLNLGDFNQSIAFSDIQNWNHLAAVYDGVRGKLYLNGVLVIDVAYTETLIFAGLGTYISTYFSTGFRFVGRVADVRVFSCAITLDEILTLMHMPVPTY